TGGEASVPRRRRGLAALAARRRRDDEGTLRRPRLRLLQGHEALAGEAERTVKPQASRLGAEAAAADAAVRHRVLDERDQSFERERLLGRVLKGAPGEAQV